MNRLNQKIILDKRDSYLKMIENSVGSKLFQDFYIYPVKSPISRGISPKAKLFNKMSQKRIKKDALENGKLSCAYFVSFILHNFDLIKNSHLTVLGTIRDMRESDWFKINHPRKGAVLVWDREVSTKEPHRHIGFYIGRKQAISNNSKKHVPIRHFWTFGQKNSKIYRKVIAIFWNKKLNK